MAEPTTTSTTDPAPAASPAASPASGSSLRLRDVWQVPVLVLAGIALIAGIVHAFGTMPKPDLGLRFTEVESLIEQAKYAEALGTLNERLRPHMAGDALTPEQRRRFYMLRGRALARGQAELNLDLEANNTAIIAEYAAAERENATLESEDHAWMSRAHASLGELDAALTRAEAVVDPSTRTELRKAIVTRAMAPDSRNDPLALEVLARLAGDADLSREDRLWVLSRQTRILVEQGFNDEAIATVLRSMPRLDGADPEGVGEVLATVASAYLNEGNVDEARRYLELAGGMLPEESAATARVLLMKGIVEQQAGSEPRTALEHFDAVLTRFDFSEDVLPAMLGAAEVEAQIALGEGVSPEASLARYTRLVEQMKNGAADRRVTVERVLASLLDRHREQMDRRDFTAALALVRLAESLTPEDAVGRDVTIGVARAERALAEGILDALKDQGVLSLAHADPVSQREARDRLVIAGAYFRRHASQVVSSDARAYADALWLAADSFDRAGDVDGAVAGFRQFAGDLPTDVRNAEAKFRLAQSYQARGDLALAAALYEELISSRADGQQAGPFADASYVPLAQSLLADDDAENDARAVQLLQQVLAGAVGGPETAVFREALLALGEHYYRLADKPGNAELAIEHLNQFLDRAASATAVTPTLERQIDGAMYALADASRLSARAIRASLAEAMPEGTRQERERVRRDRLRAAADAFARFRDRLDERDRMTALDELRLRNAHFYLGDVAFDLGEFAEAIAFYDAARERYARDPASLVALTQVVAALLELGETDRARTANARAVAFHASLPDAVWQDPTLPMTREAWARWLESQARLGAFGSADR